MGRIVRSAIVAFLFTLVAVSSPSTAFSAVTDYKKVVALFQKSNASFESDIEALEENFEVQMELIDTTYTVTTTKIEVEAQSELTEISSVLGLKIDASQKVISEALASISTWGAVEVSKDLTAPRGFSQHPGAESYLSCQPFTTAIPVTKPTVIKWPCANRTIDYPRPAKISKWDPTGSLIFGTEWRIGDQTTLFISYDDKDYRGHLVGVDQMIAAGEIKPTNPTEFSRFSTILKTEPLTLANLTSTRERQLNTVAATKSKKLSTAASLRESQIEDLEEELAEKKEKLQALQSLDNLGVLAAKRAAKNIKNFDKAFAVAFIFEHNRNQLELIADGELESAFTYRSISTLAKVLVLLDTADAIASRYDYESALKFNTQVGSAFTKELGFRAIKKYVTSKYQQATGKKLVV